MNLKKIVGTVIVGIVVFVAGFGSGIYYQKKSGTSAANGTPPTGDFNGTRPTGTNGGTPPSGSSDRSGGPGGGGVSGEIVTKDDSSITVKKSDGSTVVVYFDDSTTVSKNETGSISDLAVGTSIQAMGTTNSDKSVTGKNIMIQPTSTS